jgi:CRP/FNR family transcriptional regulator, transcriptional activator FtrB
MSLDPTTLANLPLFAKLDDAALASVAEISTLRTLEDGDRPLEAGQPAEHLYVLLSGQVSLGTDGSAGEFVAVEFLRTGDFFGTPAVLLDEPSLLTAEAIEPTVVLCVAADRLREMLRGDPHFTMQMVTALAAGYRALVRQIADLKSRSVAQRLGCYLLSLGIQQGASRVTLPVEKQMLASRLGTTPESLSRAFGVLRTCGVLVAGRTITMRDLPTLSRFARPDQAA